MGKGEVEYGQCMGEGKVLARLRVGGKGARARERVKARVRIRTTKIVGRAQGGSFLVNLCKCEDFPGEGRAHRGGRGLTKSETSTRVQAPSEKLVHILGCPSLFCSGMKKTWQQRS